MRLRLSPRVISLFVGAGLFVGVAAVIGLGPLMPAQQSVAQDATAQETPAQDAPAGPGYPTGSNPEVHGDWLVRCSGDNGVAAVCEAYRNLYLTQNEQRILHIAVGHDAEQEDAAVAILIAPLGVALQPGMSLAIDGGAASEFAYMNCTADGCRVRAPLGSDMLAAMRAGVEMQVTIAEVSGRRIVIPVSLTGFTAAFASADLTG